MRKNVLLLVGLCLLALTAGCNGQNSAVQTLSNNMTTQVKITPGSIEGKTYTNKFFGLTMTIPDGWTVEDNESTKTLLEQKKNSKGGNNQNLTGELDASSLQNVSMLTVKRFYPGYNGKASAIFIASAEKVNGVNVKTGSDYLKSIRDDVKKTKGNKVTFGDLKARTIGGTKFDEIDSTELVNGTKVKQQIYATLKQGYALHFIVSYVSEQDFKDMESMLASVKLAN